VEVLSALGRLHRSETIDATRVSVAVEALARLPVDRHPLPDLLAQAWARRDYLRISDAFYVALAEQLHMPLVTTDQRLARVYSKAEPVGF
jgi:predicted nucleic acid-binding protein